MDPLWPEKGEGWNEVDDEREEDALDGALGGCWKTDGGARVE